MKLRDVKEKIQYGLLAVLPAYQPLEPLPGQTAETYSSLGAYLGLVFKILLSIGGMIAVVTLVLGGITYMVSEVVDRKSEAKKRMQAAIIGLLLLLVSWLILNTINPNLTTLRLPGLDNPQKTQDAAVSFENASIESGAGDATEAQRIACESPGGVSSGRTIHATESGWVCI